MSRSCNVLCMYTINSETMSSTRYELRISKTLQRKVTGAPNLESIPPPSEAFEQNVKRAHFQVSVWKAALKKYYPDLVPIVFGWEKDEASQSLMPYTVLEGAALAPAELINLTETSIINLTSPSRINLTSTSRVNLIPTRRISLTSTSRGNLTPTSRVNLT